MSIRKPPKGTGYLDKNGVKVIRIRRGSRSAGSSNQKTAKKWQRTAWGERYKRKNSARWKGDWHPY